MPKASRFRAGCAATPEALLLPFVPVAFDLYRPLKPRLRWAMACLVSFADEAGRCFPSVRTFALHAGISKSAAGRDLAELEAEGLVSRKRRPGGVYVYKIARRFLPKLAPHKLSQSADPKLQAWRARRARQSEPLPGAVPERGTEEKPFKKNQGKDARTRARHTIDDVMNGLPRATEWEPRLQSWLKSQFWLLAWGPKPNEPGCFVPPDLLTERAAL